MGSRGFYEVFAQVPDSQEKKVRPTENFRAFVDTIEKVRDEQYRVRKTTGQELTYAQLFEQAWELYEQRRDAGAGKVVEKMPAAARKDIHTTTITVSNEVAPSIMRIVKVLERPGGLEAYERFIHDKAEAAMLAAELAGEPRKGKRG